MGALDYQTLEFAYTPPPDLKAATPAHRPVVVVGAGPVGLSLAIDLAQRGQRVLLLDNDHRLSTGSRAICFAKRTLEIWDRLGVAQRMVDKGVSWSVGRVFFGSQEVYRFDMLPEPGHERPAFINLQQYDPVRLATARLPELARSLGHMVAIAVWGNQGPTIVRTEEPPAPVHVSMRHGTVMSVRGTASGRLFAAFLPADRVRPALAADPAPARAAAAFEREVAQARRHGVAHAVDSALPGISALAAPVFDAAGQMVLSLTVIGPGAMLDTRADSPAALALLQVAGDLSAQLGGLGGVRRD